MLYQAGRGLLLAFTLVLWGVAAQAAQYAALVMDARDGEVLHSRNADTRLHPASLTKMMTLYLVFDAIERGQLSLDQQIRISRYAASKPPSKLGLRSGSTIELRYLIRASAVKSANDAAAAMAEAVSGSESAFAQRMTATAKAMGMSNTTFRNASGLTQSGHLSTARDMAELGRRMFYDWPQYYNLFSRRSTSAKIKTVYNTNRRLLDAYEGADGIKTGYTRAAGFNLVASAERGRKRVIVSMFGGTSSAARNARVAELMDMGFERMRGRKQVVKPRPFTMPSQGASGALVARNDTRLQRTIRPAARPGATLVAAAPVSNGPTPDAEALLIASAVTRALTSSVPQVELRPADATAAADAGPVIVAPMRPAPRPAGLTPARVAVTPQSNGFPDGVKTVRVEAQGDYILQLGGTHNRSNGERLLLKTALAEMESLEGSQRDLQPTGQPGWYRARFIGLEQDQATAACARLAARQTPCEVIQGS